ncbi:hypothetical protein [Gymnodinialimonas sp.]
MTLRALHKTIGGRFHDLVEEAQGGPLSETADPFSKIKRGVYDKTKTRANHEWIARIDFEFAQSEAPELFQYRRVTEWDQFIEEHLVEGGVTAIPFGQLGIARRTPPKRGAMRFRLGQEFGFALKVPKPCYALAFESYAGEWYPLALGQGESSIRIKLHQGSVVVPQSSNGSPIGVAEYDDLGVHTFVFVLLFGPMPLVDRASIARYGRTYDVITYRTRVLISN